MVFNESTKVKPSTYFVSVVKMDDGETGHYMLAEEPEKANGIFSLEL